MKKNKNAFFEAKKIWLNHIKNNSNNADIIGNAGMFFKDYDINLSINYLKEALILNSKNNFFSEALNQLYFINSIGVSDQSQREELLKIIIQLETRLINVDGSLNEFYLLQKIAETAFKADEMEKAYIYAIKASALISDLKYKNEYGDIFYEINHLSGRIALALGDVEEAKNFLIESTKTTGSSTLYSSGPNMLLAKELLLIGEKEIVLQFFEFCKIFWRKEAENPFYLEIWTTVFKEGSMPNFGSNLY